MARARIQLVLPELSWNEKRRQSICSMKNSSRAVQFCMVCQLSSLHCFHVSFRDQDILYSIFYCTSRPLNVREIKNNEKDILYMDEINNECTILCGDNRPQVP
jgi:hypothetical protein